MHGQIECGHAQDPFIHNVKQIFEKYGRDDTKMPYLAQSSP
jgi:hypothetical protein